ncbi:hypothetical protein KXX11_003399, partial [Aspergillus fumigatus]
MHAYAVQDSRGLLKLDAMENPFGLPPQLQFELGQRLGALALNRYPGEGVERLKSALAAHVGLPAGQSLMLGNGSDELISLLALACCAAQAAAWKLTLIEQADPPGWERQQLERAYLGHSGGSLKTAVALGLDDARFETEARQTTLALQT